MRVALFVALLLVSFAAPGEAATAPTSVSAPTVYSGLGSWLDIFASASWSEPHAIVARAKAEDVQTLYLQTSNYSQRADIVRPQALGRFIDTAHAAGLRVVAWYLPGLADTQLDIRRARAAISFRSRSGQAFDGFALDIEASIVSDVSVRNARLLSLSRRLRETVPADYPLGAIVPSPVGMQRHPHYWPHFPFAALAHSYDAFLPMAYFSYYAHSPQAAYAYTRRVMTVLRAKVGGSETIHVIGGSATVIPAPTLAGFVRAASDCAAAGISLYAFPETSLADWAALHDASLGGPVTPPCST